MPLFRKHFYLLLLLTSLMSSSPQAWAVSLRELLGLEGDSESTKTEGKGNKEAAGPDQNWAKQGTTGGALNLGYVDIQRVIANLNAKDKKTLLDNPENFKKFVQQEASNLSVLSAARANNLDKDENTRFLMQRSVDELLRELYLGKLLASKLPADFPTEQQVRDYFDKNKANFFLGERVHIWQIYLKLSPEMSKEQVAALEQRMNSIRQNILTKKVDFSDAAMQFSEHGPSKAMGGYMGLVKVSELKPELTKPLMNLSEGELSEPIKTDAGIHLLKRGAIVPKQDVTFDQVKNQIHDLLLQQARAQLRQAVYDQASKTYPVDVKDNTTEEWRQQLLK